MAEKPSQTPKILPSKANRVDAMTNEQVLNDLKQRRLPTFGTAGERRDRLRKDLGMSTTDQLTVG
jgi:hypothetical protein